MITPLVINAEAFNNDSHIEARVAAVDAGVQGALRASLCFLYQDDGPINLSRLRLIAAEEYLDEAERVVIRWLYTRTNGRLRRTYGSAALLAARVSRYRCEVCGFPDVRVLNIDHVDGRVVDTTFACLCANCHAIKSRKHDWTGLKLVPVGASAVELVGGSGQYHEITAEGSQLVDEGFV